MRSSVKACEIPPVRYNEYHKKDKSSGGTVRILVYSHPEQRKLFGVFIFIYNRRNKYDKSKFC